MVKGILGRLRFKNAGTYKNPDPLFSKGLIGALSRAGVEVTEEHIIGVSTAYACIHKIAQTVGTAPIDLFEPLPNGGKRPVQSDTDIALANVVKAKPNSEMTSLDMRMSATAGLALHRNGYCQIRRNPFGGVVELMPMKPGDVDVIRDPNAPTEMGRAPIRYRVTGIDQPLRRRDVLHLKGLNFDGMKGLPLSAVGRESIGLAIALDRNASAFFGNSSRPGMVFELPAGETLDDEAYQRLQYSLNEAHQGIDNAYKVILAESGAQLKPITSENRESQFDETRQLQALEIARFFGVPPHKIGIPNSEPRANVEEENINFVLDTITFYCEVWQQNLAFSLLSDEQRNRGLFWKFDLDHLLSGNLKDRAQAFRAGADLSVMTRNEFRQKVYGMNPLEGKEGEQLCLPPNVKRDQVGESADE